MKYLITLMIVCGVLTAQAREPRSVISKGSQSLVVHAVNNHLFTFKALVVQPSEDVNSLLRGMYPNVENIVQLTGNQYAIKIAPGKLEVYLPYFGSAYSPVSGTNDAGFKFTSTQYEYSTNMKNARNGYDIQIKPLDHKDINRINITVFENGRATVRISSNNRSAISYQGVLR
ncbi:hypothetical protein DBR32_07860 [Taibaiella sp. KBW10]|uniref:DUF4251 domain-containing protein n=1 Tax=Taibaiella sp. KBW10 TaxID=2153357 RepID=UPI000F5A15F0|nr:DUF4251 domain-containing protein [Taibaiella sp. KBW10]RQO30640.1 hypothetical protein DBR32_07860 [Taibaiella sp. KBW10]